MKLRILLAVGCLAATAFTHSNAAEPTRYSAHEWGTFTSIQGSDGTPIRWNPLIKSDLPDFVHTRRKPGRGRELESAAQLAILSLKESSHWLQRMETPVIYFHTTTPLRLTAHVGFPDGLITEWYPAASAYGPMPGIPNILPAAKESFATWKDLEILPTATTFPPATIPTEEAPSHYYAARSAQSNPVRTTHGVGATAVGRGETEQFLFYRGVGDFTTPLHLSNPSGDIVLRNTGPEPLPTLFLWEASGSSARLTAISPLAPGASKTVRQMAETAANRASLTREFRYRLQTALVGEGLHPDEANAMVQTWADSWFDEDGTRVLYLVPRPFIDKVLPLTLTPAPENLARVFVGRAELLPAATEEKAWELANRFLHQSDPKAATELGRLVVPRFVDSLVNRLQARAARMAEVAAGLQPSLEPRDKRVQEATQKVYNQFAALRSAVTGQ